MKRILTTFTMIAVLASLQMASAQVVMEGTCLLGQAAAFRVNSNLTISLYCITIPASPCAGMLDLSTGCAQLVAFGVLF
jgi:hypothetical protein